MTQPVPPGFSTLSAHLIVDDGVAALEFYKNAFGAQETMRLLSPDGKNLMHAQMKIGSSVLKPGGTGWVIVFMGLEFGETFQAVVGNASECCVSRAIN